MNRRSARPAGILLVAVLVLAGCARPDVAAPTAPAVDAAFLRRCEAAADLSVRAGGDAFLGMQDGEIVFERYASPAWEPTPHLLASGTKGFTGLAAAFAIEDGLLSLDEPVAGTIVEWREEPRKAAITVRELLSLSAGLEPMSDTLDSGRNALAGR